MRIALLICSFFILTCCWSQNEEKRRGKNPLVNEYALSTNYGLGKKGFFGAGLELCHVLRSEKVVGFRSGIGVNFFHHWYDSVSPPKTDVFRKNQHYYITNVSVPFDMQLNFGKNTRFVFELGGQFGVNAHTLYRADVFNEQLNEFNMTRSKLHLKAFVGLNAGIGVLVPLNEKFGLLLKPSIGLNLYPESPSFLNQRMVHYFGRFTVALRLK